MLPSWARLSTASELLNDESPENELRKASLLTPLFSLNESMPRGKIAKRSSCSSDHKNELFFPMVFDHFKAVPGFLLGYAFLLSFKDMFRIGLMAESAQSEKCWNPQQQGRSLSLCPHWQSLPHVIRSSFHPENLMKKRKDLDYWDLKSMTIKTIVYLR